MVRQVPPQKDLDDSDQIPAHIFSRDSHDSSVAMLDGFGLRISVSRGHLVLADGLGRHRRERRLPRAQRIVRRIVILGHTGHISLEAVRWCTDTGITLLQIDADGALLLTAGPDGIDDPRIRRAQAVAADTAVGLEVARAVLTAKLDGQAAVAEQLGESGAAATLASLTHRLRDAESVPNCRGIESDAANVYFAAWSRSAQARFAEHDAARVPHHWAAFTSRTSPLHRGGKTPRSAAGPINALLNYGYALAEAECRIAILAVGLDPGLGIVHTDHRDRDSLALDLLEPLRPVVDQHVLALLAVRYLRADEFHETPAGQCRLLSPLTHELTGWMPELARAIAPIAEAVAHAIARSSPKRIELRTPLTRAKTRSAQNRGPTPQRPMLAPAPMLPTCRSCGGPLLERRRILCSSCWSVTRKALAEQRAATGVEALAAARAEGSDPTQSPAARDKRRRSLIAVKAAEATWRSETSGGSVTERDLRDRVLPALTQRTIRELQDATGLSASACSRIRSGKLAPHPRHWNALAAIVDLESSTVQ